MLPRWLGDNNLPFDVPLGARPAALMLGLAFGAIALFLLWLAFRGGR